MNEEILDLALAKINDLEKKLEKYYSILLINNELDFILKGSYVFASELQNILEGIY